MDNQPSFSRDLIIPLLLGIFSLLGIIAVLLFARAVNAPAQIAVTASDTSAPYVFLGTEPAASTTLEGSEIAPPDDFEPSPPFEAPTERPPNSTPVLPTPPNLTTTAGPPVLRTTTPNRPPTLTPAAGSFTYDDTDPRLIYTGAWMGDPNITEAYEGTLHISTGLGDSVTFAFTGQRIHLFYQAGPSLGTISITIDGGTPVLINQAQSTTQIKEWVSETLPSGTHSILVQHFSGGSVNVDSFVVPAATTVTPGPTTSPSPTATPT